MPTRRALLLLPLMATACATQREEPGALPPLVTGYRHLTPLRLNVADIEIADPAPGAVLVQGPAPVNPEREMVRMAQDRLLPVGTSGSARFRVEAARLLREALPLTGGLAGLFRTEPAERVSCHLLARLEILSAEGARVGFVEAEARRTRTLEEGATPAARTRAAEELVRQAMEELNVEFEYQIRRTLRAWIGEGPTPTAPAPEPVGREELPSGAAPRPAS